uniref:Similar to EBS1 (EMS-MUTAGENIZED BRI1 SUPPRESSOR 1) n=1 Tax=Arundo donax TaxID=35708 RepID=A0A0A9G080_ARUDO
MGCTACSYFPTKTSLKHLYGAGYGHNRLVLES